MSGGSSIGMRAAPWVLLSVVAALAGMGCRPSIHDAIAQGELEQLRAMLDADPDLTGAPGHLNKTPLHYAVTYHQMAAIRLLAERGAELNAQDATGMTPLHSAAMLGRPEEADLLLRLGADPVARDEYGDTPAHTAAACGMGNVLQVLRRHGVDLALTNNDGLTPLELARRNRQAGVVRYLSRITAGPAG